MCLFKTLMRRADRYAAQSTWKDFALVKLCVMSLGILIGLCIPVRHRKKTAVAAGLLFFPVYGILMNRFLPFLLRDDSE